MNETAGKQMKPPAQTNQQAGLDETSESSPAVLRYRARAEGNVVLLLFAVAAALGSFAGMVVLVAVLSGGLD